MTPVAEEYLGLRHIAALAIFNKIDGRTIRVFNQGTIGMANNGEFQAAPSIDTSVTIVVGSVGAAHAGDFVSLSRYKTGNVISTGSWRQTAQQGCQYRNVMSRKRSARKKVDASIRVGGRRCIICQNGKAGRHDIELRPKVGPTSAIVINIASTGSYGIRRAGRIANAARRCQTLVTSCPDNNDAAGFGVG